ncbi:MAG: cob(I)yrinic acid a,c-diamide adenosyltransferase [Victivallales bacterium]|nr:cob(I)yrinic acid a,c-diamide adenosyltransferase [Victivallales bacterium]
MPASRQNLLRKAFVHVYTGNGKGKTTASLGLALRVLGAGGKVFFAQFIKGGILSSEFNALLEFPDFTLKRYGKGRFLREKPSPEDIAIARRGLEEACGELSSGRHDLVVLDELNGAMAAGLFSVGHALKAISSRHPSTELVITGRNAPEELIDSADLVTDMSPAKHYLDAGIKARKGIEF